MSIQILADRMIDLRLEELKARNIGVISCWVNMDGKSYSDLEEVTPDDCFNYMDRTGKVAQTAAKARQSSLSWVTVSSVSF